MKNQLTRIQNKKMQIFKGYLQEILPEFQIIEAKSNMCIYGFLPNINKQTLEEIYKQKIVFVQNLIGKSSTNEIRFNFISSSIKDIYEGLSIISKTINNKED